MAETPIRNLELLQCIKQCNPNIHILRSPFQDYCAAAKVCLQTLLGGTGDSESVKYTSEQFAKYVRQLFDSKKINSHWDRLEKHAYFKKRLWLRKSPSSKQKVPQKSDLSFDEKSKRQQDRITQKLRAENDGKAILAAAVQVLRETHGNDSAYVMKHLMEDPEVLAQELRDFVTKKPQPLGQVKRNIALAYILDCGMTKCDYEKTCALVNSQGTSILPCWDVVSQEKFKNRPVGKSVFTIYYWIKYGIWMDHFLDFSWLITSQQGKMEVS